MQNGIPLPHGTSLPDSDDDNGYAKLTLLNSLAPFPLLLLVDKSKTLFA